MAAFSNAGGGGERVLWAAIRATQKRWPKAICAVYTGDHDVDKAKMLENVQVCCPYRFSTHAMLTFGSAASTFRYIRRQ